MPCADSGSVAQVVEGNFQNLLHLARRRGEVRPPIREPDYGVQSKSAHQHMYGRELAKDSHGAGIDSDFLRGLAKRRLRQRFSRICCATRQTDLTGMTGQSAGANRQGHRRSGLVRVQQQQRGCLSRFRGKLTGAPGIAEQVGRESDLRFYSRQGFRQTLAERGLDVS